MNYRLSDINCALGNSQLERINSFLEIRKKSQKCTIEIYRSLKIL